MRSFSQEEQTDLSPAVSGWSLDSAAHGTRPSSLEDICLIVAININTDFMEAPVTARMILYDQIKLKACINSENTCPFYLAVSLYLRLIRLCLTVTVV